MTTTRRRFLAGLTASVLLPAWPGDALAKPEPLRVGMSAALSGPARALGRGMLVGIEAAFAEQNAAGGVQGRRLELVVRDDAYEPARTAPNMRQLIDEEGVFVVLGNVGTPTAAVAVPIVQEKKVPLWGAFTGAGLLRHTPPDRYVVNYRASYAQEMAYLIDQLLNETNIQPEQVAFFTQNDAYGDAGHSGAMVALKQRGYVRAERLVRARYTRNTEDVEYAVSQFIDPRNRPKVVFMVGTAPPCAKMVRLAKQYGLDALFIAVSFVGATALMERLGPLADGIVVSQVVPHPEKSALRAATSFRAALPDAKKRSFVSFEGYLAARFLIEAAKRARFEQGPDSLIRAIEDGTPIDLGLEEVRSLSQQNHQLEQSVWPTIIREGQVEPLASLKNAVRG